MTHTFIQLPNHKRSFVLVW